MPKTLKLLRQNTCFISLQLGLVSGGTEHQMKEILDDMVYAFKKVYGVGEVEIMGDREREIWVEVEPLYDLKDMALHLVM